MKKITVLSFCLLFLIGCNNTPTKVQQNTNVQQNSSVGAQKTDELSTVSSHSQDIKNGQTTDVNTTVVPKSGEKTKWTQSGNPIDTTAFDAEIKQAEEKLVRVSGVSSLKKNNSDSENVKDAQKALAEALVKRGIALTDARQYASALGDYRKALKLDPANETAKQWIEQIIGIYESINRSYPPEGEEPPPLPFKKES